MTSCAFCKRVVRKVYYPDGILLKSILAVAPRTTEQTPMCVKCYNAAIHQFNKYRSKVIQNLAAQQESTTSTTTGSTFNSSTATSNSLDSIDRLVSQRSQRSIMKEKNKSAEQVNGSVALPRNLPLQIPSISAPESSVASDIPDVPIERPVSGSESSTDSSNPVNPVITSSDQIYVPPGKVLREYESDESEDDTVVREGDRLPGVQPYIKRRRTQIVFTDERLIPVYNNKSYGG